MPLAIRVISGPNSTSPCGGAELVVAWVVGPNDIGYVVQHVVFSYGDEHCDGTPITLPRTLEYWEAWEVVYGVVYAGMNYAGTNALSPLTGMDYFRLPDMGAGTRGFKRIDGYAHFIPRFHLPPAWPNGTQPRAGVLPNSPTPPPGWNDAGAPQHVLIARWDCCPGNDEKPRVSGEPRDEDGGRSADDFGEPRRMPLKSRIARMIAEIPAWTTATTESLPIIEEHLAALRGVPLAEVRAGIAEYQNAAIGSRAYDLDAMSRPFLVNRYVLDIPRRGIPSDVRDTAGARAFGSWLRPDAAEDSALWPFEQDRLSDDVRLRHTFFGYAGAPFDALREFDAYVYCGPRRHRGSRE